MRAGGGGGRQGQMTVEFGEGEGRWGLSCSCSESGKASVHASDVDRAGQSTNLPTMLVKSPVEQRPAVNSTRTCTKVHKWPRTELDEAGLQGSSSLHTQLFPGQLVPRFTQGGGLGPPAHLIANGLTYGLPLRAFSTQGSLGEDVIIISRFLKPGWFKVSYPCFQACFLLQNYAQEPRKPWGGGPCLTLCGLCPPV